MNTEQKHEIDISGLPKGYRAVAYRRPVFGEYYFYNDDIQQNILAKMKELQGGNNGPR